MKMKVHFFKVEIKNSRDTIYELLERIYALPAIDRERRISDGWVFLEELDTRRRFHNTEFTQRRTRNGPGRSEQGKPTKDFPMGQGVGFGEHSAAVWSSSGEFVAMQYNHWGLRPGAIARYLSGFLSRRGRGHSPRVDLIPELDDEAIARLQASVTQTRLECAIDGATFSDEMVDHGNAVTSMLRLSDETAANRVEIALSYGMGRRSGPLNVMPMIRNLLRGNPQKLKVGVKGDFDSKMEMLDLIEHRYVEEIDESELLLTSGLRWDWDSRINAIQARFEPWLNRRQS